MDCRGLLFKPASLQPSGSFLFNREKGWETKPTGGRGSRSKQFQIEEEAIIAAEAGGELRLLRGEFRLLRGVLLEGWVYVGLGGGWVRPGVGKAQACPGSNVSQPSELGCSQDWGPGGQTRTAINEPQNFPVSGLKTTTKGQNAYSLVILL